VPVREAEKQGLREMASSPGLGEDMERLARCRRDFFLRDGAVDTDRVLEFLCGYNAFINHVPKKFRRMNDHNMKL